MSCAEYINGIREVRLPSKRYKASLPKHFKEWLDKKNIDFKEVTGWKIK